MDLETRDMLRIEAVARLQVAGKKLREAKVLLEQGLGQSGTLVGVALAHVLCQISSMVKEALPPEQPPPLAAFG